MSSNTPDPALTSSPWYDVKNIGSAEIPPFGIVEIDSPDGAILRDDRRVLLRVKQPTMPGFTGRMLVNGPLPISGGGTGVCTDGKIVVVAYDDKDGTPAAGDIWGPVKDSSKLRKRVPGCRILRPGEKGRATALRFEQFDLYGKLTEDLEGGGVAECKVAWFDKDASSNKFKLVESGDSDPIRFEVRETLYGDDDFETLGEDDRIIARYDEATGGYILRGWKCV